MSVRFLLACAGAASIAAFAAAADLPDRNAPVAAIPFVANSGQFDGRVAFAARTRSGTAFVTTDGRIVYRLGGRGIGRARGLMTRSRATGSRSETASVLTETFVGGSPRPRSGSAAATRVGSFLGGDPSRWRSLAETYRELDLGEVWPGVRVRLVARAEGIEKVLTVAPGASLESVRVAIEGGTDLELEADGSLCATTAAGPLSISAPVAAQADGDSSTAIPVEFRADGLAYGFSAGEYDRSRELVVDPIVQSTYLGGGNDDKIEAMAIAANGDVVVAGRTVSLDFPVTSGGRPAEEDWFSDGFVARLTTDLRTVIEAIYLGGSVNDHVAALALAEDGDVVVGGSTDSPDFPKVAGGARATSSELEGFVARLSGDLGTLRQATYVGGGGFDTVAGIALAANGDVVAAGQTSSLDLPHASGGAQDHNGGAGQDFGIEDAFAVRLRGDLKSFVQATYLGGTEDDQAAALAIAGNGDVVVVGRTASPALPGADDGAQPAPGFNGDAFVARLAGDLKSFVRATYLGGGGEDSAAALAIAGNGDVVVAGTTSGDFPRTAGGAQEDRVDFDEAFVARLTGDLRTVEQATYLGGEGEDGASAVAVADDGDLLVAGGSASPDFPGVAGGAQEEIGPFYDAFVARLAPDLRTIVQATFLGGDGGDGAFALALDARQDVVVAGSTQSTDLPRSFVGAQPVFAGVGEDGDGDGFVARLTGDLKAGAVRWPVVPAPSPGPELVGPR